MKMMHTMEDSSQNPMRGALARFWMWLCDTVAGNESECDGCPCSVCYYDE